MMMPAFKTPRLSHNLLKCLYSHCICSPKTSIMLFIIKWGTKPPIVIFTVVVVVIDIAARQQHFRAASLLPQMMPANKGPGGSRRDILRCHCRHRPRIAKMFRFHRPSVFPLSRPLQLLVVIIVPLLLSLS
jgi:hypothetical protein